VKEALDFAFLFCGDAADDNNDVLLRCHKQAYARGVKLKSRGMEYHHSYSSSSNFTEKNNLAKTWCLKDNCSSWCYFKAVTLKVKMVVGDDSPPSQQQQ